MQGGEDHEQLPVSSRLLPRLLLKRRRGASALLGALLPPQRVRR